MTSQLKCDVRSKVLFLAQLPPPRHGASLLNGKALVVVKRYFRVHEVDYNFVQTLNQLGQLSFGKFLRLCVVLGSVLRIRIKSDCRVCYFSANVRGSAFFRDFVVACLLKGLGYRVIYHLHGLGVQANTSFFLYRVMYRFMFKRAVVICVSESVAKNEFSWIDSPDFRVSWATNGISLPYVIPEKSEDSFRLCHMSNLRRSKGVLDVLEVLKNLRQKGYEVFLDIIGDYRDEAFKRECVEYLREAGLEGAVKFCGVLSDDKKYQQLAKADVFLYPTYDDSFGLVMLEAMAAGALVVAYDEGSVSEIVDMQEKVGEVVVKGEVDRLANVCETVINERHRYATPEQCRAYVGRKFNSHRFENDLMKILCEEI